MDSPCGSAVRPRPLNPPLVAERVILKRSAAFEQHNPAWGATSSSFFHAPSLATAHSNAGIDYKLG